MAPQDVQDQVSRFFLGNKPETAYQNVPNYGQPNYGYPNQNPLGGPVYGDTSYYGSNSYRHNDINLTMQLGQAALIVFIISAIIFTLFLLILLCMFCSGQLGGGRKSDRRSAGPVNYNPDYPGGYASDNQWSNAPPKGSLTRAQAVDNLSGSEDFEGRSPNTSTSTSSVGPTLPQPIRRSRSHTPASKKKHKSNSDETSNNPPPSTSNGGISAPKRQTNNIPQDTRSMPRSIPSYYLQPPKFPTQPDLSRPLQSYQNAEDFSAQSTNRYLPYHESQLDRSKLI